MESSTDSAEWALLLECARPNPDLQRLNELLGRPVDWPVLFELAEDHGVLGLLAIRLRDCSEAAVPTKIAQELRERHRAHVLLTLRLTAEMFRLLNCFASPGLATLVIKGPVLAERGYGDPNSRQYRDLDLIVRDADILRVSELMIGLGYEPRVLSSAIQAKKAPGEYAFRQASTKLLVEFHTELTFRYHPRPIPLERLFKRQARVKIDAREIPALSPEDELILICIHGAKHFWERLNYIADVAALVSKQELDWKRVRLAADEVGAERMLCVGLRLAADVLGASLPEESTASVRTDPAVVRIARQVLQWLPAGGSAPPGIFTRAIFRIRMHGGFFSGPAYLFRLSFSPTEEDWVEGAENKRHWFLEAVGRPFRLARKYGRDNKS
ncbi:MAG TPA: nucleotidyltransferase family protein [Candidatus Acidoferrum sp.]|nr:nucleotidyltransferase family protein [Candidatus Acidoferrum sp.]